MSGSPAPTWRTKVRAVAAVVVLAGACSGSHHNNSATKATNAATVESTTPLAQRGSWVGRIDGTNALIALVSDGLEVTAYACDSATVGSWFRGLARGGRPELSDGKGALLDATLSKDRATGSFTNASGKRLEFTARAAHGTVLYRAQAQIGNMPMVGGWILGPDGEQRGSVVLGSTRVVAPKITSSVSDQVLKSSGFAG